MHSVPDGYNVVDVDDDDDEEVKNDNSTDSFMCFIGHCAILKRAVCNIIAYLIIPKASRRTSIRTARLTGTQRQGEVDSGNFLIVPRGGATVQQNLDKVFDVV